MLEKNIQDLIQKEIEALQSIPVDDSLEKAIELIYQQVHVHKGKLIVSGMGKAGQIGMNIATTMSSTGTPSVFLHPSEAQHGDLGVICENDILLMISNSGKTREIVELEGLARNLVSNLKIISLTGNPDGTMRHFSDVTLFTGHPDEICPLGLTPTTSTTVMTVVGDILVVLMMQKIGFSKQDYAKRHHGGYLGIKAKQNE
jgi:arabinose-5-phosphate isomerase